MSVIILDSSCCFCHDSIANKINCFRFLPLVPFSSRSWSLISSLVITNNIFISKSNPLQSRFQIESHSRTGFFKYMNASKTKVALTLALFLNGQIYGEKMMLKWDARRGACNLWTFYFGKWSGIDPTLPCELPSWALQCVWELWLKNRNKIGY